MPLSPEPVSIVNDLARTAAGPINTGGGFSDSLIGLFQAFRPDGLPDDLLLEEHPGGSACRSRLQNVYDAVAGSRRQDAMMDAYFIVRNPRQATADAVQLLAGQFVAQLVELTHVLGVGQDLALKDSPPMVRVLEGKAPKHPKAKSERAALLNLIELELPDRINAFFPSGSLGELLAEPLYFVACDRLLCDYLRWPLIIADSESMLKDDFYSTYFRLWSCGIKFRVFNSQQIDFYVPRYESMSDLRIEVPLDTV